MPNEAGGIGSAWDLIPDQPTLPKLREAVTECRACRLWRNATQAVFGEGTREAEVMMIGEQPGDREDRAGKPFVGPAGRVLDQALDEAGIDRTAVFVTNVVKHFKFDLRGKRRIHKKPAADEIAACRPWLQSEIDVVKPKVVVCLGATAAQAVIGRTFRVTQQRGRFVQSDLAEWMTATVHPSSILRAPDDESRQRELEAFVQDIKRIAGKLAELGSTAVARKAG
jgi:uracil-DNA glycosylase family protein